MKVEIQDQLIAKLRKLAWDLGLEEPWSIGLGIVLWFRKGLTAAFPAIEALGAELVGKMGRGTRLPDKVVKQLGLPRADEQMLRSELDLLTDDQGISLLRDVVELCEIGPAMIGRATKSYGDARPKLSGLLPSRSKLEKRRVCERILELQGQGKSPAEAKKVVSQEFRMNMQMVHRTWRERAELLT